jgi:flagellar biosynthesis protein FlhF
MAIDPHECAAALESLHDCDVVLIDTMGLSPNDRSKIEKIQEALNKNRLKYTIEVMLVLQSTVKYDDLQWIYDHFSLLGIDSLIFTKLDETRGLGNIFSLLYATKRPVSYVTTGQEVPEDLMVAQGDFLTHCVLNGFHKE